MDRGIIVSVPLYDPHPNFMCDFIEWYAHNKDLHNLSLCRSQWEQRGPLHKKQQAVVKMAQERNASHILFTEDDHWRFPLDGLEVLLAEDKDVIGFQTFSRKYPFHALNMRRIDPDKSITYVDSPNMRPFERVEADQAMVQETDLISWAFTLVKTEVFDRLPRDPFASWDEVPTDSHFCQACDEVGIDRFVHFGWHMPHGDVTPENRWMKQRVEHAYKKLLGDKPEVVERSEVAL